MSPKLPQISGQELVELLGKVGYKVISDPILRDDLIDIALIEKAKKVKGKSVSAREYFKRIQEEGHG